MICLKQNQLDYDYDIRSMIGAFYNNEKITTKEDESRFTFSIYYEEDKVTAAILDNDVQRIVKSTICDYKDKVKNKNQLKRLFYEVLSEYAGKTLPWGTLTGIRPTKIAVELLEKGFTKEMTRNHFLTDYLTTKQKAQISTSVAQKELDILSKLNYQNEYSLYIGIPFCPTTCLYCSFTSFPIHKYEAVVEDYLDALFKEIDFAAKHYKNRKLLTIYIGGGTPTSLSAKQLDRLLTKLRSVYDFDSLHEITVEAGRPDSITKEKLQVIKDNGVTRISINPQTMSDSTLKLIGRAHCAKETIDAYLLAREVGFDNINMDIIVGLPGEGMEEIAYTLKQIKELKPDSLTVHSLAIKRAANLNIQMEHYKSLVKGSTNEMLELVDQSARELMLVPYYLYRQKNIPGNLENIGYASPGKECLYNILIMEEKQTIIALGAGASSKYVFPEENRIERVENVKDVSHYISRIDEMIKRKEAWS